MPIQTELLRRYCHKELDISVRVKHLLVVGDQKTYTRLWNLKHTFGTDLDWVIPFIGDWHLLSNFQSVLMKVYFDAGLRDLAETARFRGETFSSSAKCSNFNEDKLSEAYKDFLCYISTKIENNSTWKFWKEFVFRDGFSYLYFFFHKS